VAWASASVFIRANAKNWACAGWRMQCCRCFKGAVEKQLDPAAFVEGLKKQGKRVPGIGHRIKSKDNRDARVELLQQYARKVSRFCWSVLWVSPQF
jgi:citrate synthase